MAQADAPRVLAETAGMSREQWVALRAERISEAEHLLSSALQVIRGRGREEESVLWGYVDEDVARAQEILQDLLYQTLAQLRFQDAAREWRPA